MSEIILGKHASRHGQHPVRHDLAAKREARLSREEQRKVDEYAATLSAAERAAATQELKQNIARVAASRTSQEFDALNRHGSTR